MSVPEGATRVEYTITTGDDEPWLDLRFDMPLGAGVNGEVMDGAAQAAADHVIARLGEEHPEARVRASRRYIGAIEGDPWPIEEEA